MSENENASPVGSIGGRRSPGASRRKEVRQQHSPDDVTGLHSAMLALEPRLVFDAAIGMVLADPADDPTSADNAQTQVWGEAEPADAAASLHAPAIGTVDVKAGQIRRAVTDVAIVDMTARQAGPLLATLPTGTPTHLLTNDQPATLQVARVLEQYGSITTLYLALDKGERVRPLAADLVGAEAGTVALWRDALVDHASIRVFGSAEPADLTAVADLTGVEVSAADLADAGQPDAGGRTIVFIDSRVPDAQSLINGLLPGAEVHLIDGGTDGIGAVGQVLAGATDVSSVHIFGHGQAGSITLGSTRIDDGLLSARSAEVAAWAGSLTADADILLFACDVGQGDAGGAFIARLATLTGADIAASSDDVGGHAAGADWTLEIRSGQIEAALQVKAQTAEAYAHVLTTAPVLADAVTTTRATTEDATVTVTGITVADVDTPAEVLTLTITATNGTLTVTDPTNLITGEGTGTSLTLTGTAANLNAVLANTGAGSLTFTPTANFNNGTASIQFVANDGDQNSNTVTVTVNITAVNDAPTLTPPTGAGTNPSVANPAVAKVNEGNGNFVVLTVAHFGIADIDTDAGLNAAPQTTDQIMFRLGATLPTNGELVFDPNGDGNLADARALVAGSLFSWKDVADGKVVYRHLGNQASPLNTAGETDSFTVLVNDGAGAETALSTVLIDIVPINQAPGVSGAAGAPAYEGRNGVPVVIAVTDVDDSVTGSFTFTFGALSNGNGGVLYLDNDTNGVFGAGDTNLTAGGTFTGTVAALNALLRFDVSAAEPTATAPSFTLQVTDAGGGTGTHGDALTTLNGTGTVTLTILENNDDPVLATNSGETPGAVTLNVTVADDRIRMLTAADLSVTDADSAAAIRTYTLTAIPPDVALVQFQQSPGVWVNLGVGGSFTQADIAAGNVRLYYRGGSVSNQDYSFQFAVRDGEVTVFSPVRQVVDVRDGGTRNPGDTAYLTHTFNFRVDMPGTPGFPGGGTDPGVVYVSNDAPSAIAITPITAADVHEGGSVTIGGTAAAATGVPRLSVADGDTPPDQLVYRLTELPSGGSVRLNGNALGLYGTFTQADVNNGLVSFLHAGGEDFIQQFRFTVSDGRNITAEQTVAIDVRPVNDTPSVAVSGTANILEGGSFRFNIGGAPASITLSDVDGSGDVTGAAAYQSDAVTGGALPDLVFTIETLPGFGTLYFDADGDGNVGNATEITAGNRTTFRITQADLDSGRLVYVHSGNEQFVDSFDIRVDDGQPITAGAHTDTTTNHATNIGNLATVDIRIAPVNDVPAVVAPGTSSDPYTGLTSTNTGARVNEGGRVVISGTGAGTAFGGAVTAQLTAVDPDNTTNQRQFRIVTATTQGALFRGTSQLGVGSVFTQADLDAGLISYRHNGAEATQPLGTIADFFTFRVSDASGGTEPLQQFNIEVAPTNDAPTLTAPSGPVNIVSTTAANNVIGAFTVGDTDLTALLSGETDEVTAIVRLLDTNGNAIANYADINGTGTGVTIAYTAAGSVAAGGVGGYNGINNYLVIKGTRADVQAALTSMTVTFGADLNLTLRLQVIIDDRLRDVNGVLTAGANGGTLNNPATVGGEPVALSATATALSAWAGAVTVAGNDPNLAARTVDLRISTINEAVVVVVPGAQTINEDTRVRISGITGVDPESAAFNLPITMTLSVPVGQGTLDIAGTGIQATITPPAGQAVTITGDGTNSIVLTGRASDITALIADATLGLFYTSALNSHVDLNGGAAGDVTLTVAIDDSGSRLGAGAGSVNIANNPADQTIAIDLTAVNDAPTLNIGSGQIVVTGGTQGGILGATVVSDVDAADGTDYVRVTVRLLQQNGTPFTAGNYTGVTIGFGAATGATVVGTFNGTATPLVLEGTRAQVNAALNALTLDFGTGNANDAQNYQLQVVVDDRLRDGAGVLTGAANGGATLNQTNSADATQTPLAIPTTDFNDPLAALPVAYNLVAATRTIFVSGVNDPASVTAVNVSLTEGAASFVLNASNGNVTVADPDDNGGTLTATVTVPTGFTISAVGSTGGTVTGTNTATVTITGTETQINARLKAITVQLPNPASTAGQIDFNSGPLNITVTVSDGGNTGARPGTLTGDTDDATANPGDYGYADGASNILTTTRTFTVTVTAVNDAPTVTSTAAVSLADVSEDTTAPAGATITSLFAARFADGRDDVTDYAGGSTADTFAGVAIVAHTPNAARGTWEYSTNGGTTWTAVGTRALANALVLGATDLIRFLPAADYHGPVPSLTVRMVEAGGAAGGTTLDLSGAATGGTTRYSDASNQIVLNTSVTTVNDRPATSGAGNVTITVAEDTANPTGSVLGTGAGQLLFGRFTDATDDQTTNGATATNATALSFIAITANGSDAAQGTWQFLDGATWRDVPTAGLGDTSALVLAAGTQIRFVPAADFHGTPGTLTIRLADGDTGSTITTSANGTASPTLRNLVTDGALGTQTGRWSDGTLTVATTVTAVNDRPTGTNATLAAFDEDTTPSQGTITALFGGAYSDATDNRTGIAGGATTATALGGAAIVGNSADAATQGHWQYFDGAAWQNIPTGISDATALLLPAATLVRFDPVADYNGAPPALSVRISDTAIAAIDTSEALTVGPTTQWSELLSLGVTINPVEDDPRPVADVNSITAGTASISRDAATGVRSNDTDPDAAQTLTVVGVAAGNTGTAAATGVAGVITGTYGTVTIAADGSYTYTLDNANAAVIALPAGSSLTDVFTYTIDDGAGVNGAPRQTTLTITINGINEAPTITGAGNTVITAEDTDRTLTAADFNFADVDTGASLASVEITGVPLARGQLLLNNVAVTTTTVVTRAQIDAGLLVFRPTADTNNVVAGTDYATFTYRVNDGTAYSAANGTMTIDVTPANDRPVATGSSTLATVLEDAADPPGETVATLFTPRFSDAADDVAASGGSDGDTALAGVAVTANAATAAQGVWQYNLNGGAGWVTIPTAGLADATALILPGTASLRFLPAANFNGTPGDLTVRLSDGTGFPAASAGQQVDITAAGNGNAGTQTGGWSLATAALNTTVGPVNDAPTLPDFTGQVTFAEGGTPVRIDTGVTLGDIDSPNLGGGTLTLHVVSGGNAADLLSVQNVGTGAGQIGFAGGTVTYAGVAIGTAVGGTGATDLVITFNAAATLEAVDALIEHLTFERPGVGIPATLVNLRITIVDGDGTANGGADTVTATSAVQIDGVNVAPVLADTLLSLSIAEDSPAPGGAVGVLVSTLVGGITDVNVADPKGIAITGAAQANGTWWYSTDNGATWSLLGTPTATAARLLLADATTRIYFQPSADFNGTVAAALTVRAWDRSTGTAGGVGDTTANGAGTAYSTALDTVSVTVTPVNDAPLASGSVTLPPVAEDSTGAAATLSAVLPGGGYSDAADSVAGGSAGTALAGVAIVGNTSSATQGTWEYSTDGVTWTAIPTTVSDASAVVVGPTAALRFVPAPHWNGDPGGLSLRLSDGTGIAFGSGISLTGGIGGIGGWSTGTIPVTTTVTPVNDAPTATGSATLPPVLSSNTDPTGTALSGLFADGYGDAVDTVTGGSAGTALAGFAIVGNGATAAQGSWQYSTDGTTWTTVPAGVSDASALVLPTTAQVRFLPAVDFGGAPGSLTIRLSDGTGLALGSGQALTGSVGGIGGWSSDTVTVATTVTPNNLPPVLTGTFGGVYTEQAAAIVLGAGIAVTDPTDKLLSGAAVTITAGLTPGDALSFTPAAGITGSYDAATGRLTLTGTASIADYQAVLGSVAFASTSDDPTLLAATRQISVTVTDANAAGTGALTSTPVTGEIRVIPVNDAPTVLGTAAVTYTRGAPPVSVAAGAALADLDDTRLSGAVIRIASGLTAGDILTVQLTGSVTGSYDAASGTLTLSGTDTVAAYQAIIRSTAFANDSFAIPVGLSTRTVEITVTDANSDGVGARTSAVATIPLSMTTLATPPDSADRTVTIEEDRNQAFTAADFTFTDRDIGDTLESVQIGSLPAVGTLTLNGVAVTVGQIIPAGSLGGLLYTPPEHANGSPLASFSFIVRDQTGTADPTPNTITINVTPVADPPDSADRTVTIEEDKTQAFSAADFAFTDRDAGDTLASVQITGLPAVGTLTLNGATVSAGQIIPAGSLGGLLYTPPKDASGSPLASFSFVVRDQTGVADPTPNTITINVTPLSDPPDSADKTVTIEEDKTQAFSAADFAFADPDIGDTLASVQIGSLPAVGTLTLNGVAVAAGQIIPAGSLGGLLYTPPENASGSPLASFSFIVRDQTGTADPTPNTITINVTPVADPPDSADKTVTIEEDKTRAFSAADFAFTDRDAGDTLASVQITGLPAVGTLTLNGVAVTAGQIIPAGSLGGLLFTPPANASGSPLASFSFVVRDQTGAADPTPNTITINVTPVNDPPDSADRTVTVAEDTSRPFNAADFVFTAREPGDALASVRIDSLPATGTLTLNGVAVTAGQVIAAGELGGLVYTPPANANGSPFGSFGFTVTGTTGLSDPTPNTITINVTPVNDPPDSADLTVTIAEDASRGFTAADFAFTDPDNGDTLASVQIASLPAVGTLTLNGVAVSAGQIIPAGSLGGLLYTPPANASGSPLAAFSFIVRDQTGAADPTPNTITIIVTPANDPPESADRTVTIPEDTSRGFTAADFAFTDPDAGDSLASVQIASLPAVGTLTLNGVAVSAGQVIPTGSLGGLTYTPPANGNGSPFASFSFIVRDQAGNADPAANTITINVTPVNDPPESADQSFTIAANATRTFTAADFVFTDIDPGDTLSGVRIIGLPATGTLTLNGVAVTAGQVIPAGSLDGLAYTPPPDASGTPLASFTFAVIDSSDLADVTPNTMTINVTPPPPAPVVTPPPVVVSPTPAPPPAATAPPAPPAPPATVVTTTTPTVTLITTAPPATTTTTTTAPPTPPPPATTVLTGAFPTATPGTTQQPDGGGTGPTSNQTGGGQNNGLLSTGANGDGNQAISPLTLVGQVPNQVIIENRPYQFQVQREAFRHSNPGERLVFEASRPDGSPLPAWISFDPATLRFQGTPPPGTQGSVEIVLVARDSFGNEVTATFRVNVSDDNQPVSTPTTDQSGSPAPAGAPDVPAAEPPAGTDAQPPAGDGPPGQEAGLSSEGTVTLAGADFQALYDLLVKADRAITAEPAAGRDSFGAQIRAAGAGGRYAEARALLTSLDRSPSQPPTST